ncbi:hypothetical protein S7S_12385 [Isoalcanivorax pacificus W11-5]|uniref:DUF1778 domain-containing protein n=1 Tax=Isoalcanivorax pacificus W11-5 TaxID=391936 RepID=A0A0B4XKT5_9GAMM|nr:DUF1778 domain-containing protein [Isoalcanivorax pacificus]AJD48889.1 hypothetical protein S7S_12385 [Isoalcanivorax pacificus W11-5]
MSAQTEGVTRKDERLNLRVDARTKAMLVRAAEISGARLTDFLLQTALDRADRLLSQPQVTRVSNEEFVRVLDMIEHPPAPTDYLVAAMKRFD